LKAHIIRLTETESTNSYAISLLSKNRPSNGSVIITGYQTHGRGTDANKWESEKDKNLTFSIILYPEFTADRQFLLNKAISIGIFRFLQNEFPKEKIAIKWPNDIYINDYKACGILIQNSIMGNKLDYVVVGIGLNVNQNRFISDAPNPISMNMVSGKEYNLDKTLHNLLASIFEQYERVNSGLTDKIEHEYQNALYRVMEWHDYLIKGLTVHARITGTSEYGQLLLESNDNQKYVCDLKEVKFLI